MICERRNLNFNGEWISVRAAVGEGSAPLNPQLGLSPSACHLPGPFAGPAVFSPPTVGGFLFVLKPLVCGATPDARACREESSLGWWRPLETIRTQINTTVI